MREGPLETLEIRTSAGRTIRVAARWFRSAACGLALLVGPVASKTHAQVRPPNDNFTNAVWLVGTNLTVHGNNNNATKEHGEPDHAANPGGKSVWWFWRAPDTGYITISTLGSVSSIFGGPLDTLLAVYRGNTVSTLTEVASNDDGPVDVTSQVMFHATGGTIYRIAVDGYSPDVPTNADSVFLAHEGNVDPASDRNRYVC